jgi:hypothetical protein
VAKLSQTPCRRCCIVYPPTASSHQLFFADCHMNFYEFEIFFYCSYCWHPISFHGIYFNNCMEKPRINLVLTEYLLRTGCRLDHISRCEKAIVMHLSTLSVSSATGTKIRTAVVGWKLNRVSNALQQSSLSAAAKGERDGNGSSSYEGTSIIGGF